MHAKGELPVSYSSKFMAKVKKVKVVFFFATYRQNKNNIFNSKGIKILEYKSQHNVPFIVVTLPLDRLTENISDDSWDVR